MLGVESIIGERFRVIFWKLYDVYRKGISSVLDILCHELLLFDEFLVITIFVKTFEYYKFFVDKISITGNLYRSGSCIVFIKYRILR